MVMTEARAVARVADPLRVQYLYVAGGTFSGSTLLAFILNAHPEIVSIGEPYSARLTLDGYRCSCGEFLIECPFFAKLRQKVNELGSSFDLTDWGPILFHVSRYGVVNTLASRPLPSNFLESARERLLFAWPGYAKLAERNGRRVWHLAKAGLEITGKRV
ncbi:MAG TPA: hypothetical protein VIV15_06530, partial [Anaerolineales bacterium]